jgi:hypothetical protein
VDVRRLFRSTGLGRKPGWPGLLPVTLLVSAVLLVWVLWISARVGVSAEAPLVSSGGADRVEMVNDCELRHETETRSI